MATKPLSDLTATWNAAGTTFTAIKMNVTDTASASGSLLIDLQVGAASRFKVTKAGELTLGPASSTTGFVIRPATASVTGFLRGDAGDYAQIAFNNGFLTNGLTLGSAAAINFTNSGANPSTAGTTDLSLFRDAADALAQRRGTNAQAFRVYNTYTDASNYERGRLEWSSNVFIISTSRAGTGSSRELRLQTDGASFLSMYTNGTARWAADGSGHFIALTDNTYDIGASGATRPRNVHIAGYVSIGDGITAPGAGTGQARIYVDTDDGDLKVVFADGTVKTIVVDT
jgi:hypothetical protein